MTTSCLRRWAVAALAMGCLAVRAHAQVMAPAVETPASQAASAAASASAPRPVVQDNMAQRVQACTVCHGEQGRATNQGYFPRIAGKPPGYLYNQLRNFQTGRRSNPAMAYLVEHLSDAYLREIGEHFGSLELPYPPPQPADAPSSVLGRGKTLVWSGDKARGIPACVQCHGHKMTGVLPAFPGLLGLPRDYLIAQIGGWRTGQRRAAEPDCMATVASRLSPEDVTAVAAWLAAQPLPEDTKPAPRMNGVSPLKCGSGPR